eukprot:scaffold295555_cov28-Tisochrysis_lutea.AAC.13
MPSELPDATPLRSQLASACFCTPEPAGRREASSASIISGARELKRCGRPFTAWKRSNAMPESSASLKSRIVPEGGREISEQLPKEVFEEICDGCEDILEDAHVGSRLAEHGAKRVEYRTEVRRVLLPQVDSERGGDLEHRLERVDWRGR